ncbi:MAG: sugar ABC transporter ATP-binding protein [Spirochaetales bacterium]|uniref:Sugar ABC transporter ATP-binding protein n=1 Tax=Candidatus Thalassospirochaeta sargassi TaxID=3119039 RepID=A0AAJ1MN19_9SPIO|nr:sugar ABC transporter ATP-binding protein [Spirochaetales bacterium]
MGDTAFIELNQIVKDFPGVKALKGVDFSVYPGEVHGLIGENGAGKSTIIKIMMGVHQKNSGSIKINGDEVIIDNIIQAGRLGLAAVYQDLNLAMDLSIGENFFIGNLPKKKSGLVNWKYVYEETEKTLKDLKIVIDPRKKISELSPAMQEMVAIAKTVHLNSKLVIFDEPTALLTNEEVEILFDIIKTLKKRNVAIVYISHRLEEIFDICDRVTIFKDGEWVDTTDVEEIDEDQLINKMVGRNITEMYNIGHQSPGDDVIRVKNLTREGNFQNISFDVKAGEIFGFFGLVGSGRTEIMRAIFGADKLTSGSIELNGKPYKPKSPIDGIKKGIGFLPEDRKEQGLALALSVKHNINLSSYKDINRFSFVDKKQENSRADKYIDKMSIKTPSRRQTVGNLSGGNQQKVVIGKWLCNDSNIFIFDEPTVGIDVGAKREIYKLMEELAAAGKAVILISSYLPEVMGLSDRMAVIYEGNLTAVLDRKDFSEERILKHASGIK